MKNIIFNKKLILLSLSSLVLFSSPIMAENWSDKIKISGFMTAAYQQIDEDNFFDGDALIGVGSKGSWTNTKLGLNLNAPINNRTTIATQLFSTQEGDNYSTHLDWAFISYGVNDELKLRAGKIKFVTGIVNEYVDVGNTYPWIDVPTLFYTNNPDGPNNTREAYTGASAVYEISVGDAIFLADVYTGELKIDSMYLKQLIGTKLFVNYDDIINLQMTYFRGEMTETTNPMMNGKIHSNIALGINFDLNDIIGYAEWAKTDMEIDKANSTSWYTTLGYQMDDFLPHITYQNLEKGKGTTSIQKQSMITAGLRYDVSETFDIKFEYSSIRTDEGKGLFNATPEKNVNKFGIAIDVIF